MLSIMINNAFIISKKKQKINLILMFCMSHDAIVKVHVFIILLALKKKKTNLHIAEDEWF